MITRADALSGRHLWRLILGATSTRLGHGVGHALPPARDAMLSPSA
jgi:hypothetical protein